MNLQLFVDDVREQLLQAAENSGEESRAVAQRMTASIDSAVRLVLLAAISAAADEITLDLAPGSVEVRLRGRDPEFAVTVPPDQGEPSQSAVATAARQPVLETDDGGAARITLRLSEALKIRVEDAASREALSVNAWLVRALTAATDGTAPPAPTARTQGQTFTGWVQ